MCIRDSSLERAMIRDACGMLHATLDDAESIRCAKEIPHVICQVCHNWRRDDMRDLLRASDRFSIVQCRMEHPACLSYHLVPPNCPGEKGPRPYGLSGSQPSQTAIS